MGKQFATVVKSWIGKKVEWEYAHDPNRGSCLVATGVIEDVKGRNALIGGSWLWIPDLHNLKPTE